MSEVEPVWLLAGAVWFVWDRWFRDDSEEPDEWTPEGAARAMNNGEISMDEQARRAAAAAEAGEEFRDALERVDGIGPSLSGPIRAEYPGREFIKNADAEELEEIHGVGESKAAALKERFS